MDSRTQERVERWDSRPFDGDLPALAAGDFSGAVVSDGAWLFVLGGRIVGVVDGAPEAFAGGSGTAYEAPHRALPLLCSMKARCGAPRGTYDTTETPLEEIDRTLREGSFTGFVELSENVHSGDYYLVYYGGRRMAVAYVGDAERLLVGTDAFERAADEVGSYAVVDVEIDVRDVAELDVEAPSGAEAGSRADGQRTNSDDERAEAARATAESRASEPAAEATEAETDRSNDEPPQSTTRDDPAFREARDEPAGESARSKPGANGDGALEAADRDADVDDSEAERESLRARNRELSATVDRLRSRVRTLEAELEDARAGPPRKSAPGPDLGLDEALSQTNLFVRYESRSQPTLGAAREARIEREAVDSNLRLEYHTRFDDVGATVDGDPFEEVLADTMAFRFLEWLATELFFEIRDTGRADALADLYEGISRIDRVELRSAVSLGDGRDPVEFDVVAYDKRGSPLLVAILDDSRDPIPRERLESARTDASAVADRYPEFAAALVVARSYFEPGALEVVEEATRSGFLSRGSRLSYVNDPGYHICLAEARSAGFHLTVPEL